MKVRHAVSKAIAVAVLSSCLSLLTIAQPAFAKTTDPFTPRFSVSTSTAQAGAHPDLTIEMHKIINHCPGELPGEVDPNTDKDQIATTCLPSELYEEQDLKKLVLHLPPGLASDINAAPYCDPYQYWFSGEYGYQLLIWSCSNPGALVGTVDFTVATCDFAAGAECLTDPYFPPGASLAGTGGLYNDRPRPAEHEQGHLVLLWPGITDPEDPTFTPSILKIDMSVTVHGSDVRIDSVADNIPDILTFSSIDPHGTRLDSLLPDQIADMTVKLFGSTGIESGHPLLTNPTFCDPQSIDAEIHGYAFNSVDIDPGSTDFVPGHDDPANGIFGTTVPDSAPYQATGCDQVPYDPKLSLSFDTTAPDKPAAISTTITQADGEATTKKTEVTFPSAFKINTQNKSTFCSDADLAASNCPESSRIGTATASSRLLPIGQTLTGNAYLTGLTGDSVKLSILLSGFINLRVDGTAKLASDGSVVTTFDNQPATPISQFKLNLEGGDKGLLKTPKRCGLQTATATFTSHSGKTVDLTQPIDITGCADPTLDATLSSRRPGAATDLDLELRSQGTRISKVTFGLARHLHWGRRAASAAKAGPRSAGTVSFTTASGELATHFAAQRTRSGGIRLKALAPRAPKGQVGASAVPGFAAGLFRTRTRQEKVRNVRRKKAARRSVSQADLVLSGLPQNDLTGIELSLKGKGTGLTLRNPRGCGKPLNFVALVTTVDGRHLALKDQVRLKGKSC